jgi:hypothetical protein
MLKQVQHDISGLSATFGEFSFNFVDRGDDFLFNYILAELIKAEEPIDWGEFRQCRKGYPLILTRQLTSQATKGREWKPGDLPLAFF